MTTFSLSLIRTNMHCTATTACTATRSRDDEDDDDDGDDGQPVSSRPTELNAHPAWVTSCGRNSFALVILRFRLVVWPPHPPDRSGLVSARRRRNRGGAVRVR